MVRSLSDEEVKTVLSPERAMRAMEQAFGESYGHAVMPARVQIEVGAGKKLLVMPCYDRLSHALGAKYVVASDNPRPPEQRVQASYVLTDARSGEPQLLLAANYLTDVRTAAVSALATKFMARRDARTLGIFGTGRQAWAHLRMLPQFHAFERILICGRAPEAAREFVRQAQQEIRSSMECADARTCAAESEVLCTCTSAKAPLFDGKLLKAGTHLNCVGTFRPDTREVDEATVLRSRVVVDTLEGALKEAGELIMPLKSGAISAAHIVAELHEIVSGKRQARRSPEELTLFKSVGCAWEDLACAMLIQQMGQARPA